MPAITLLDIVPDAVGNGGSIVVACMGSQTECATIQCIACTAHDI